MAAEVGCVTGAGKAERVELSQLDMSLVYGKTIAIPSTRWSTAAEPGVTLVSRAWRVALPLPNPAALTLTDPTQFLYV